MIPLKPYEIRDLDREISERIKALKPMAELAVVKSYKEGKYYGAGMTIPEKDLILNNIIRIYGGLCRPQVLADQTTQVTCVNIAGASKTLNIHHSSVAMFTGGAVNHALGGSALAFGNPAAPPTPARTDSEIANKVAEITPSSTTTDLTNYRVITTGSYVWAAGGTVRCAGKYLKLQDNTQVFFTFLIYYDAVSDVEVPAGGTVSVTYTTQF